MCMFAVVESELRKPTVAKGKSEFLCTDCGQRSKWLQMKSLSREGNVGIFFSQFIPHR